MVLDLARLDRPLNVALRRFCCPMVNSVLKPSGDPATTPQQRPANPSRCPGTSSSLQMAMALPNWVFCCSTSSTLQFEGDDVHVAANAPRNDAAFPSNTANSLAASMDANDNPVVSCGLAAVGGVWDRTQVHSTCKEFMSHAPAAAFPVERDNQLYDCGIVAACEACITPSRHIQHGTARTSKRELPHKVQRLLSLMAVVDASSLPARRCGRWGHGSVRGVLLENIFGFSRPNADREYAGS
jgi:hypothetical protein